MKKKTPLSTEQTDALLKTLKARFEKNSTRHKGIKWEEVELKLQAQSDKLQILWQMEESGGEPDVTGVEKGKFIFCDCSAESPKGRRSICYDHEALEARKKFKPADSAMNMAEEMGVEILNEDQYHHLQSLGEFDTKTSSWLKTPDSIRKLGGAIFGDRRFNHVFIYHNGAESYYGSRGFRGMVEI